MQKRHSARGALALIASMLVAAMFASCANGDDGITVIWTNQAEFASYAELFNASQSRYQVVVEYKENPSGDLLASDREIPDLIIGPWLKNEKTRARLKPLDYLFTELRISSGRFYKPLLDLGNVRGQQYLLPVSFNLPAVIFSTDMKDLVTQDFSLSLDEIKAIGSEFNEKNEKNYVKMGFSPRWTPEFLYIAAQLYDTRFEEGSPLFTWNKESLETAVTYLREWTRSVNTSATAEDDFQFKYLYDPPYTLVTKSRSLFSLMESDELFVLPHDKIQNIDFRWITREGKAPVRDNIVYLGICRKAKHRAAAEAFIEWFYDDKNQRLMLERSKKMGTMDRTFGISGGFSAIQTVNEKTFPVFYPSLLAHVPPKNELAVPRILPNHWETYKAEIVIPYLVDAVGAAPGKESSVSPLEHRISDWQKTH